MVYDDNFDHITPLDCAILSGLIHIRNLDRNLDRNFDRKSKSHKNKSPKKKTKLWFYTSSSKELLQDLK